MAVNTDEPLLANILQQGLDAIPASERASIYNQWRSIRYSHAVDLRLLWKVLAGGAVLLAVVGWWNRRLAREVDRRRRAESALIEARDQAERASRAKSDLRAVRAAPRIGPRPGIGGSRARARARA
jgi:type II secretory pathway component PulM